METVHVILHLAVHKMSSHLLVMTIFVNLAIQIMVRHIHCIQMILSGMEKDVVVMKQTAAQLLVFRGFIRPLTLTERLSRIRDKLTGRLSRIRPPKSVLIGVQKMQ